MKVVRNALKHLFLIAISLLNIFPFYWMIVSATNYSKDINKGKLTFGNYLLENIKHTFLQADMVRALLNTVYLAIIVTCVSIVICALAGYGFVIFADQRKAIIFNIIVASMMVPFAARIIPMFRMFSKLGLLNTFAAIILPAIGSPFLIFFFKQNTHSFPHEIIQAARIDGIGEFGIFFKIYAPIMRPTFAAAGIFALMGSWNNYMWPLIALQSNNKFTLPLTISNLAAGFAPDYGMVMIGILFSTIPILIIFFVLQKQFVEGLVGSVK